MLSKEEACTSSAPDRGVKRIMHDRFLLNQGFVLVFTFICYTAYHMSRKPLSVVKSVLHQDCYQIAASRGWKLTSQNASFCSWRPFEGPKHSQLIGALEYAYLFTYALGMLVSGHLAERIYLRYYLALGMVLSGVTTSMFGLGYFWNVHSITYYMFTQILGGLVQATGWPSVVACMGNWFGKERRGLIMGVWNSHTSAGNIIGSIIAGFFVNSAWGLSFLFPGIIMILLGIICHLFLVPHPSELGFPTPTERTLEISITTGNASNLKSQTKRSEDESVDDLPYKNIKNAKIIIPEVATDTLVSSSSPSSFRFVEKRAIGFFEALRIPGVVEYSLCLFFAKLVSYTFLYWLPNYIKHSNGLDPSKSAYFSTFFDVGGIFGGIFAGVVSDMINNRAATCTFMFMLAAPMLLIYQWFGGYSLLHSVVLLFITGGLVNGPYALITTAVSADLGTSSEVEQSSRALATVTAIIDGTGSMGAALGPLLTGIIVRSGWQYVFYMLIAADLSALCICATVYLRGNGHRESLLQLLRSLFWNKFNFFNIKIFCLLSIIAGFILIRASNL